MSDIPEIPPQVLVYSEQAYAEANERLAAIVADVQRGIREREKLLGIKDDSFHYVWLRDFIINSIAREGSLVSAVILSAALFNLARAPRVEDPLAHLESEQREDEK